MPTITQLLVVEHAVFLALFDQIDAALDGAETAGEANRLARIVEGVLRRHGESEAELAYAALDQMLAERGELQELHQDHREIDENLRRATTSRDLAAARDLLRRALKMARAHLRREERSVFPLFERVFSRESLEALGGAHLRGHADAARVAATAAEARLESVEFCPSPSSEPSRQIR